MVDDRGRTVHDAHMGWVLAVVIGIVIVGLAVWAFRGGSGRSVGPYGDFGGGSGDDGLGRRSGPLG
jgi:hypothetical protein